MDGDFDLALRGSKAPRRPATRVAIVGGGASGVLATANLLRSARGQIEVVLIERAAELGRGIAYSTRDPDHLLNVPAAGMSAFAGDPEHFLRWLRARGDEPGVAPPSPCCFAPRRVYGEYLGGLLNAVAPTAIRRVNDECTGIEESVGGVRLSVSSGDHIEADFAILATGHDVGGAPVGEVEATEPWDQTAIDAIGLNDAVFIAGTGLTMVDVVVSLHRRGHRGPIAAVSRRGLSPSSHRPGAQRSLTRADVPLGGPISRLTRWLRNKVRAAEAAGGDWRGEIDALRPHTRALWQAMTTDQRRRFLRHARPWWDVHRHRMAPVIAEVVATMRAAGQLRVLAGRIETARRSHGAIEIAVRRRGATASEIVCANHIIGCTGTPNGPQRSRDPLIRALLESGVGRADPLGIGLDVSPGGAVIDVAGRPSRRLFVVGPPARAAFWEMIAIPDIRNQCAELADRLVRHHDPARLAVAES